MPTLLDLDLSGVGGGSSLYSRTDGSPGALPTSSLLNAHIATPMAIRAVVEVTEVRQRRLARDEEDNPVLRYLGGGIGDGGGST